MAYYCKDKRVNVFMKKKADQKLRAAIHRDPTLECGVFLIGNIFTDQVKKKYTAMIDDVYNENRSGTASNFEFTTDYKMSALRYARKTGKANQTRTIGNAHSHARFDAFWSEQDWEMLCENTEPSVFIVVSPTTGKYKVLFKDENCQFYDCNLYLVEDEEAEADYNQWEEEIEGKNTENNGQVHFHVDHPFNDKEKEQLNKRFLYSIETYKDKKVLMIGGGTLGNLIAANLMNAAVGNVTVVDFDNYFYWNIPRSSMIGETSNGKPKAFELARAIAEQAFFPITVNGINKDVCQLGWEMFKDYDLVLSPVDSMSIRQFVDRGCKLYHVPHITCGTDTLNGDFKGEVLVFPKDSNCDLEYVWGTGYRGKLEQSRSCSDVAEDTQPQAMAFSSVIAGYASDLALKVMSGAWEEEHKGEEKTTYRYMFRGIGHGYATDKKAFQIKKYGEHYAMDKSELYSIYHPETESIPRVEFDHTRPKSELWKQMEGLFQDDCYSYYVDLEWSMIFPIAYHSVHPYAGIEITPESGVDPLFEKLPPTHIYKVLGDEKELLVELTII